MKYYEFATGLYSSHHVTVNDTHPNWHKKSLDWLNNSSDWGEDYSITGTSIVSLDDAKRRAADHCTKMSDEYLALRKRILESMDENKND